MTRKMKNANEIQKQGRIVRKNAENITIADLQESHRIASEADTIVGLVNPKKSWWKRFFYVIYRGLYIFYNGRTPEATKELRRVQKAINKVDTRSNYLRKDFFKNRDELFKLLAVKEMLVNYECDLYGYYASCDYLPSLGLHGSGDSNLIDEVLDPKW